MRRAKQSLNCRVWEFLSEDQWINNCSGVVRTHHKPLEDKAIDEASHTELSEVSLFQNLFFIWVVKHRVISWEENTVQTIQEVCRLWLSPKAGARGLNYSSMLLVLVLLNWGFITMDWLNSESRGGIWENKQYHLDSGLMPESSFS